MIIELFLSAIFLSPAVAADSAKPLIEHSPAAVSAANRRFAARCAREPLAVDALVSDAAFRADLETCSADEERDLVEYSACRSLQGAAGGCSTLDGLGHPFTLSAADCRSRAAEDRFVFLALRGGDALSACRALLEIAGKRGPSVESGCAAVIEAVRGGNASASCAALAREKLIPPGDSCPDMMISWSGDPKACDRIKDANTRYSCRGRASLVAALRAPAQCAASPSCQVLVSKSPGACDPLRARFSRALCARVAKDVAAEKDVAAREQERLRQAAQQAKDKAEKAAVAAAAAKAKAAQQAEADAIAQAKAAVAADQEKVARQASEQAAKAAAAAAAVRAKADAEARKAAAAKAQIAKQEKAQFQKGEPMQKMPVEAAEVMKAIEEGRPIPKPKPEPKKKGAEEAAPSEP